MTNLIPAAAFLVGLLIGALVIWLLMRSRIRQAVSEAIAAAEAEKATLHERLEGREQGLTEAKALLQQKEILLEQVQHKAEDSGRKFAQCLQAYRSGQQSLQERTTALEDAKKSLTQKNADIEAQQNRAVTAERELAQTRQALESEKGQHGERCIALQESKKLLAQKDADIEAQQKRAVTAERDLAQTRQALESEKSQHGERTTLLTEKESLLEQHQQAITTLNRNLAQCRQELEGEKKSAEEKLALLQQAEQKLSNVFKSLASDVLNTNNESFLKLAKTHFETVQETAKGDLEKRQQAIVELVKPVKESLEKVDGKIQELEKVRAGAYSGLTEQVKSLVDMQKDLRNETANLVKALRTPNVRGRWGEVQLRRVVEIAGMVEHCDFNEQESADTEDGKLRPDMLVRLPGQKNIVVDSKAPLLAYLEAVECDDEEQRKLKLRDHARQIRTHIEALGKKAYFEQFQPSPEFIVMFLPGEAFLCAAEENNPQLTEFAMELRVLVATPTTLIALLKSIAYCWRQENLARNAKDISDLGQELYRRCSSLGEHFAKVGNHLGKATEAYNKAVGSLESRVLVTARKFGDFGAGSSGVEVEGIDPIEITPRILQAPEFVESCVDGELPRLRAPK